MGLIWWGVVLIAIGLLLGLTGAFGMGGALQYLGWILLIVGVVLAIIHAFSGRRTRTV